MWGGRKFFTIFFEYSCKLFPGTVVKAGEGEMMKKMSEAFDILEEDLWRGEGGEGREGRGRRRELVRMSLPVTFAER